jgi:hypothetical protein
MARFALAVERDELDRVLPLLAAARSDMPGYWLFQAAETFAEAELGRLEEARRHFDALALDGFARLPRDNNWVWGMVHLAYAATKLEDPASIERLVELLLPYRGMVANAAGEVVAGPIARAIGQLATSLAKFDLAEDAFHEAIGVVERTGWRPWEGWVRYDRGRMLKQRGQEGDADRARDELRIAAAIASELGMTALQRRVAVEEGGPSAAHPPQRPPAPREPDVLRREGDIWAITFEGRTIRVRHSKGLGYLARLLADPGREIPAIDLAAGDPADTPRQPDREPGLTARPADAEPVIDDEARRAYRARLQELEQDIAEAESLGDIERASRLREEFQYLTDELLRATGLGGRERRMVSSAERARQSVSKAIRETLDRIQQHDPALGGHLRHAVRTGMFCVYDPDPRSGVRWTS